MNNEYTAKLFSSSKHMFVIQIYIYIYTLWKYLSIDSSKTNTKVGNTKISIVNY